MNVVLAAFLISVGINLLMFIPAYIYKTDQLTDISYAVTFAVVTVVAFALSEHGVDQFVLMVLALLWAYRLGSFLWMRIKDMKRDRRFDGMRENFWKFLKFWLAQGVSVFIVLLAAILAWQRPAVEQSWLASVGLLVFLLGLTLERAADQQKFAFNHKSVNKGKWIEQGVWKLCRHPNYLGEILVWIGVYIVAWHSLSPIGRLVGLASPLYIICLLLFVSGVPILEKSANERWGKDPNYQTYKKRVPVLVPSFASLKTYFGR